MKSERSQVQESNLLADKIEHKIAQMRPYLPAFLGLIVLAVLCSIGYAIYASQLEHRSARAWTDFYFSDTQAQDLEAISQDFSDTSAGLWARLLAGDASMAKALEKWNIDRSLADQFFQQASEDYRQVAEKASESFAQARARYGLAQALEGLGKRIEAADEYRQVTTIGGVSPELLAEVNQRIQWLESKEGESFFVWYTEKRTSAPQGGEAPTMPNLPSLPNINFPTIKPPSSSVPSPSTPLTPTDTVPTDTVPTDSVPTSTSPEVPAATEVPATDGTGGESPAKSPE